MKTGKNLSLILTVHLTLLIITPLMCFAQSNVDSTQRKVKGYTICFGAKSLGLSEYNTAFKAIGVNPTPDFGLTFSLGFLGFSENDRFFWNYGIDFLSVNNTEKKVGKLNYSFVKQDILGGGGFFLVNNKKFMIPIQMNLGLSTSVFNSHTPRDNSGQDFNDILQNGSGTGISNLVEISLNYKLSTGFDFKTNVGSSNKSKRHYSTNFGFRTGLIGSTLKSNNQSSADLKNVNDIPTTDKTSFFITFHITWLLYKD